MAGSAQTLAPDLHHKMAALVLERFCAVGGSGDVSPVFIYVIGPQRQKLRSASHRLSVVKNPGGSRDSRRAPWENIH